MNGLKLIAIASIILIVVLISGYYGIQLFYIPPPFKTISTSDALQLIEVNTEGEIQIVTIDIRTVEEYNEGHIKGAINIPMQYFEDAIGNLEHLKNDIILVYSNNGIEGNNASQILSDNGFARVYNLEGGISAWINDGYPLIPTEIPDECAACEK